jgi:DUF917 family protein
VSFELTSGDLPALSLGSSVLACGGGGNPYYGQLVARRALAKSGPVSVIDLEEMDPDALAVLSAQMGAPLVAIEKPVSLAALHTGYRAVERAAGDRIGAFVAAEVGGSQSVLPVLLAALTGKPLIDGDFMGRAFPEAQMCTFMIYGFSPGVPASFSDDHGLLFEQPRLPPMLRGLRLGGGGRLGSLFGVAVERVLRRYTARKGGWICCTASIDRPSIERSLVRGSLGLALAIGRAVQDARGTGDSPIDAILETGGGRLLFQGRVSDLERRFRRGHDWGRLRIEGLAQDAGRAAEIAFKNEYLVLHVDAEPIVTVPDLISVVETESGTPVTTEVLRTGLRVGVLGFPSSPLLRTPKALRVVGPRAFGYALPFVPIEAGDG